MRIPPPRTALTHLAKCSESSAPAATIAVHSSALSGLLGSVGLVHKPRVFQVSPFNEVSTKRLFFFVTDTVG